MANETKPEFPRLHPRTMIVQQARNELGMFMLELDKKYEMTPSELFSILSQEMGLLASTCIRSERDVSAVEEKTHKRKSK